MGKVQPKLKGPIYHQRMMAFLEQQIKSLQDTYDASSVPKNYCKIIEDLCKKGNRLIQRHRGPFDLRTFYTSEDARNAVESICEDLRDAILEAQLREVHPEIGNKIPDDCLLKDKMYLRRILLYILEGGELPLADETASQEWRRVKDEHEKHMRHWQIADSEIQVLRWREDGGCGSVCEAKYSDTRVAVKKFFPQYGQEDVEAHAEFLKEVYIQAMMNHMHVTKLYKITMSGRLIIELADKDLQTACREEENICWPVKLNLVQQADEGLAYMHKLIPPLVHCDVKSKNFLVFGSHLETCTIKIADFGLARDVEMSKSVRPAFGTLSYVAPEICSEKKVHTLASDVYSFDIVMYEVMSGQRPYVNQEENSPALLVKNMEGVEPCCIDCSKDCPPKMLELMKHCCCIEPKDRPTMEEVYKCLSQIPGSLVDEVSVPRVMHRCSFHHHWICHSDSSYVLGVGTIRGLFC